MAHSSHLPLFRTRAIMFWEQAYAAIAPVLAGIAGFIGVAMLGGFYRLPPFLHAASLLLAAIGIFLLCVMGVRRFRWPNADDVATRLEKDANLPPGLIKDLRDTPFGGGKPSALWAVHQRRLATMAFRVRPQKAKALIDRADPFALRYGALLILLVGGTIGGASAPERLRTTFAPFSKNAPPTIADIWVSPPDYTGRPPQFLVRAAPLAGGTFDTLTVPAGSVFNARLSSTDHRHARPPRGLIATADGQTRISIDRQDDTFTLTHTLDENSAISLRMRGHEAIWPVQVTADRAPSISWQSPPSIEGGVRTTLSVNITDDYGVTDSHLSLTLADNLHRPPDTPKPSPEILASAALVDIPALKGRPGRRQVTLDLSNHPWAGLPVILSISVKDGAGQEAATKPLPFTLPARTFYNPLARTVIEERQKIALSPTSWRRTARLLDALTFAPDRYAKDTKEFLLLRTAFHDVNQGGGHNSQDLVESFWPLAIALEDEGLTLARQRLEAAQEALRKALARNAPPDEVDRLVEAVRRAMDEYVSALAASGDADAPQSDNSANMNERDLDDILDEIAELRRQGDTHEARQRLSELEQLLQNLQISPGGSDGSQGDSSQSANSEGGDGQGNSQGNDQPAGGPGQPLNQAGDIISEQRQLSDDTFSAERGDRGSDGLEAAQRTLSEAAHALQELATQPTTNNSEEHNLAAAAFGNAAQQMDEAANALAQGDLNDALGHQEDALAALRQGAGALASAAASASGTEKEDGSETGEENDSQASGQATGPGADRDPLGRLYHQDGQTGVEIPDLSDPERIRDLTQALRQRLSEPGLSDEERTYLERLLKRF